jgi:hypothetical protein
MTHNMTEFPTAQDYIQGQETGVEKHWTTGRLNSKEFDENFIKLRSGQTLEIPLPDGSAVVVDNCHWQT